MVLALHCNAMATRQASTNQLITIDPVISYREIPNAALERYYDSCVDGMDDSHDQERFNRYDLQDILSMDWSDRSKTERGFIALLCNAILG